MIELKNAHEISIMAKAGEIVAGALETARDHIRPGITTRELDALIEDYIRSKDAIPSFKGYGSDPAYPAASCISVNDVVVHGIPSGRKLAEGDIVSIDVGACFQHYHGDAARTYPVGAVTSEARHLMDVTRQSFYQGIEQFRRGNRLMDISHAIQTHIESNGFHVVRALIGHGIGSQMHMEPDVPNFGKAGRGVRLVDGLTLAIEPMVGMGTYEVYEEDDGWTVCTADHSLAAHYENTVALLDGRLIILTQGGEEI